jgi:glycosyltransferase involved in cell wall biosynthesis
MPSYNSERFIGKAIESVINQSYLNWELLIIDGLSSDKTREIVAEYANSHDRVRLIDNKDDQGPSQARSVGILASQGEYIAFIDSDDLWLTEKLEIQLDFLISNDFRFCFTQFKKLMVSIMVRTPYGGFL